MTRVNFNVEAIEAVHLDATGPLVERDLMSPYVWRREDGLLGILLRAVPRSIAETGNTGTIWCGESEDGLVFRMGERPVLAPDKGWLDEGGCEDPTLLQWNGKYIVYYTGVDRTLASGHMLYAMGDDLKNLKKQGVALASTKTAGNTKEATIKLTPEGRWRLFYEYARDDASLIGLALGEGVAGPWQERPEPFAPRPDSWDNWHLSTGPIWNRDPDMPVMFYNGATRDARWRIGWIAFDRDCTAPVDRCIEPLIIPPPPIERDATDIAFAASVVEGEDCAHLYFSRADKALFRAIVRRTY